MQRFFIGESVLFSKERESFLMAEEVINDLPPTVSVVVAGGEDAILWTLERSNFDTKVKVQKKYCLLACIYTIKYCIDLYM